jgi:hypothetical protein
MGVPSIICNRKPNQTMAGQDESVSLFLSVHTGKEGDRDMGSFTCSQSEVCWEGGDVKIDTHSCYTQPI